MVLISIQHASKYLFGLMVRNATGRAFMQTPSNSAIYFNLLENNMARDLKTYFYPFIPQFHILGCILRKQMSSLVNLFLK